MTKPKKITELLSHTGKQETVSPVSKCRIKPYKSILNQKEIKEKLIKTTRLTVGGYNFTKDNAKIWRQLIPYIYGIGGDTPPQNENEARLLKVYQSQVKLKSLDKGICLIGEYGTGKSTIMRILRKMVEHSPNVYPEITVNDVIGAFEDKNSGQWDTYTVNRKSDPRGGTTPKPIHVCLNEFGRDVKLKNYSNTTLEMLKRWFFERYDIFQQYGKVTHITTNLDTNAIKAYLNDDELIDRFREMFHFIYLGGSSYRK